VSSDLGFAETQLEGTAQKAHKGTETGAVMAAFHFSRQRCTGAGGAAGAHQTVQPVLDHQRRDRRNLDHLMAHGRWILSLQQGAAVAAGIGVVLNHLIHPFGRQKLRT